MAKSKNKEPEIVNVPVKQNYTSYSEYAEGAKDYQENCNRTTKCPNSPYEGAEKIAWLVGWLDARTANVLVHQK